MARTFLSSNKPPPQPENNNVQNSGEPGSPMPNSTLNEQAVPTTNSSSKAETSRSQVASQANLPTADHQTHPPQPSVKEAVLNYPAHPSAPVYASLFPHPRELTRDQGRNTPLALPRSSAFAELESSLPPLMGFEELDQLEPTSLEDHLLDPHRGVAPSEINSRATSIALASARSTPVPAPVDHQEFLVTRREAPPRPPSQTAQPLRTRGSATPMQNQLVLREMTEAPQPQDQVTTMSNILHGQWLLFINSEENRDFHMMRIALNQAIITQDALETMIGTTDMLKIADGWSARDELCRLNQAHPPMLHPQNAAPPTTHPQTALAIEPVTYQYTQELSSDHQDTPMRPATANQQMAPPPPPPPMRAPVPVRPVTGHQAEQNLAAPPIPPRLNKHQAYPHQMVHRPQPTMDQYYHQGYYEGQPPLPPLDRSIHAPQHPPAQGYQGHQHRGHPYRRPFQRNWQRRPDPISSMMEMGNFLMRAERVMGRMQRLRNRGGRGYRGNRGNNQFHHPPYFPQ
ncbi:hypothetical protein PCASD_26519 [Puccinia coronata f. sp. avenae]|uniref:Uncharacterized protein n=1 Tax=Puccinia coronata f. sp. avenae TaxID=200324 RepID=A0A2N5S2N4_9BASI|nr:hypothetical protein PCASD_26519 [Puccinia coronata f. sp. avenae]